jgi:hypothetical protein
MDLDISHYTTDDMIDLLELDIVNKETIDEAISFEKDKHKMDKPLVEFLDKVQHKLLATLPKEPVTTFQTEVKRGIMNPDLKNTLTRIINIDSASRVHLTHANHTSDNFTFELTEPLLNVVSMALYSVEIPYSWYSTDIRKGTSAFILCRTIGMVTTRTPMKIASGNYTNLSLPDAFIAAVIAYTASDVTPLIPVKIYDPLNGVLSINFGTDDIIQIVWFDYTFEVPNMEATRYNSSLGWMLGFRAPISTSINGIMIAHSLVDASGTKYIILALNDYKTNRLNKSIVSVNTVPKIQLRKPSYFNESIPQYRISQTRVHVIPSDPRTLTSKQIHTINSINDQVVINQRSIVYDGSDTFAKIPFKKTDWNKYDSDSIVSIENGPCKLFVDASGPLQLQAREYFGPVNITTMSIGLYDDKGNLLGLNGMDWSCTLLVKCLYQY